MTDNEKAKNLYEDIVNCSSFAKLQAIATQLSELIHCHKHRKVGDGYVLSILCAMRNAIWDSEDSNNSYWHTGTPTEEGWYLVAYQHKDKITYRAVRFFIEKGLDMEFLDSEGGIYYPDIWKAVAWQKIEPYEEEK